MSWHPVVQALCNDCGERSTHPTRSEAFLAMDLHEYEHGCLVGHQVYVWQQYECGNGWQNYRAPVFGNTVN